MHIFPCLKNIFITNSIYIFTFFSPIGITYQIRILCYGFASVHRNSVSFINFTLLFYFHQHIACPTNCLYHTEFSFLFYAFCKNNNNKLYASIYFTLLSCIYKVLCISGQLMLLFLKTHLSCSHSKQAFLQDVPQPHDLPDGTPSFKDFMGNRNNRFTNPEAASKNRILSACQVYLLGELNLPYPLLLSLIALINAGDGIYQS